MLRFAVLLAALLVAPPSLAADVPALFARMAGDWDVRQRMWLAEGVDGPALPPAVASRRVMQGAYLVESMEASPGEAAGAFTRQATINYDAVAGRFEYFSMDSRAPQQMAYKSPRRAADAAGLLALRGGRFVAAEWGPRKQVPFRYRLDVADVVDGRQTVRLYLTPVGAQAGKEFLAFEYLYSRRS